MYDVLPYLHRWDHTFHHTETCMLASTILFLHWMNLHCIQWIYIPLIVICSRAMAGSRSGLRSLCRAQPERFLYGEVARWEIWKLQGPFCPPTTVPLFGKSRLYQSWCGVQTETSVSKQLASTYASYDNDYALKGKIKISYGFIRQP